MTDKDREQLTHRIILQDITGNTLGTVGIVGVLLLHFEYIFLLMVLLLLVVLPNIISLLDINTQCRYHMHALPLMQMELYGCDGIMYIIC